MVGQPAMHLVVAPTGSPKAAGGGRVVPSAKTKAPRSTPPPRILLIEDNPGDVFLVRSLLGSAGSGRFDLRVVHDLASGVEALRDPTTLILLDLRLPDAVGSDAVRVVRQHCAKTPIIVLTGLDDEDVARECLERGAQDYVSKQDLPGRDLMRAIEFTLARMRSAELSQRLEHADRLAAVGTLTASVAHEINNPASAVLLNLLEIESVAARRSQLNLADLSTPADVAADIDTIHTASRDSVAAMKRIVSVVQSLNVFAHRDGNGSTESVDVVSVCRGADSIVGHQVRLRAAFELDLVETPPVRANASQLGQVLVNLLINASQSIGPGDSDPRVRLSTRSTDGQVVISVADTGQGIPAAGLERIFEPFFTTKPPGEGTGLGLSISREIVERLGGRLEVRSRLGEGTTFEVRLPAAVEEPEPGTDAVVSPTLPTETRHRVLLIDDEEEILRAMERSIIRHHDVVAVHSGLQALELLRRGETFDVISCDLTMPELDGAQTLEAILSEFPEMSGRLLMLSGGTTEGKTQEFLRTAAIPVLWKPATAREILEAIEGLAEQR